MDELQKKIASIRLRLRLFRAFDWALWGLVGSLTIFCLIYLVLKFTPPLFDEKVLGLAIIGFAIFAGLVAGLAKRLTMFEAALATDSRLKLRERISSAVLLQQVHADGSDAFHALEEDARRYASAIRVGNDFRYKFPRHGFHAIWPILAIVGIYFIPPMNLFAKSGAAGKKNVATKTLTPEERKKKAEPLQQLAKKARANEETLAAAKDDLKLAEKLERLSEDVSLGKKNEKEALAEMSRLQDDVKLKQREMNNDMQPFKQLKGLQQANETRDMQQDLKNQDFKSAADKMQKMAEKMANPEQTTSDEKQDLAKELQQLSEQLKDNPQMADAMQKASEAMKQAAEEQKQQEQSKPEDQKSGSESAQASQNKDEKETASSASQNQQQQQKANQQNAGQSSKSNAASSQKAQQAAQAAQAAMQQAAAQMQDMQDMQTQMQQLSELQSQMAQAMAASSSSSGQSQSKSTSAQTGQGQGQQPGQSPGQTPGQSMNGQGNKPGQGQGQGNGNGPGSWQQGYDPSVGKNGNGGLGRGSGFRPDSGAQADKFVDTFIPGQKNEGQIIAVFDVDAPAPKGESNLRYTSVPAAYQQRAADSMTDTEIPVGMRNSVKDYFERINFGTQGSAAPQQAQPPAEAPAQPAPSK